MRSATHSNLENGLETAMDAELKQKVIEGIKNQFGPLHVTRIEGFLVIQIGNSGTPLNIHISYKDVINGLSPQKSDPLSSSTSSPSTISSPYKNTNHSAPISAFSSSSRKVNRRKAYMPMRCEEAASPPVPPPAHSSSHATLIPRSHGNSSDDLTLPPSSSSHSLTVDPDTMGPLNADAIQASMSQVMHNSLPVFPMNPMNQFSTDIQLPMSIVNTVIPVPQMMGDSTMPFGAQIPTPGQKMRLGKSTPEQRKIKPKPMSYGGAHGAGSLSTPYQKPPGTTSKRNPNKEFACNQCTERFKSLNLLTEHTTLVHLCFRCTTCNSKFTQRSNLQRHSLKHLGFKPFKCSICLKEYYRKDHLVRHIEVSHPGSEPKSSILNVMPSADCLRILEESQAQALRMKQAAKDAAESGRASAPETPVASKLIETPSAGPSPAASDTAIVTMERSQPTDLSVRTEVTEETEEEDEGMDGMFGMEIVNDLMVDEDDLEEDLDDELEELEMDLDDDGSGETSLLPQKQTAVNGDSNMIRLPNPSASAVDSA